MAHEYSDNDITWFLGHFLRQVRFMVNGEQPNICPNLHNYTLNKLGGNLGICEKFKAFDIHNLTDGYGTRKHGRGILTAESALGAAGMQVQLGCAPKTGCG